MIYLSSGHTPQGPNADPGAVSNGVKEAELAADLRNRIATHLAQKDARFLMDSDRERLAEYIKRIKPGSGSVLLEIHFNAGPAHATGVECLVKDKASDTDKAFAADLNAAVTKSLGIQNRGVKSEKDSQHSRLAILHTAAGISALLEVCFITNPTDMQAYRRGKDRLAEVLADVLIRYDAAQ